MINKKKNIVSKARFWVVLRGKLMLEPCLLGCFQTIILTSFGQASVLQWVQWCSSLISHQGQYTYPQLPQVPVVPLSNFRKLSGPRLNLLSGDSPRPLTSWCKAGPPCLSSAEGTTTAWKWRALEVDRGFED